MPHSQTDSSCQPPRQIYQSSPELPGSQTEREIRFYQITWSCKGSAHAGNERVTNHIRLHSDKPGAAGSWWVFLLRPVGCFDLPLGFCHLSSTELFVWNKTNQLHEVDEWVELFLDNLLYFKACTGSRVKILNKLTLVEKIWILIKQFAGLNLF